MKDNFSLGAEDYAKFRPHYPVELFEYVYALVNQKNAAWDCGTGNGQVAGVLADAFKEVFATDISQQQLDAAIQKPNIYYSKQPAEQTSFPDQQFDLIVVAQAIHWFTFDAFYAEVKRTLKPGSPLVVLGYGLMQTEAPLQRIINHFYTKIIGPYWDAERHYIDEQYQSIPFPFKEIEMPFFEMKYKWSPEQLLGYLGTWSAVKHYEKQNGHDPVQLISNEITAAWGNARTHLFRFPVLLRAGR